MDGLRFDWYQPTDADFIDELVATVIDTVNIKRKLRLERQSKQERRSSIAYALSRLEVGITSQYPCNLPKVNSALDQTAKTLLLPLMWSRNHHRQNAHRR